MSEPVRRSPRLQQSRLVFTLTTTSAAPASKKSLADKLTAPEGSSAAQGTPSRLRRVLAQRSMAQCFVSVGLAPDPSTGLFVKYKNHRRGTMPIEKVDQKDDETCLGEIAAELEMVQRDGVESDDEGEQEQGDEEDEDEDEDEEP